MSSLCLPIVFHHAILEKQISRVEVSRFGDFRGFLPLSKNYRSTTPSNNRHDSGFTLIELMIVMVIIAILMSASVMGYLIARDKARAAACKMSLDSVKRGLELYMNENKNYPIGSISTFADLGNQLSTYIEMGPNTSCSEPINYTSTGGSYKLETYVYFTGNNNYGFKYTLQNSELTEEQI